MKMTNQYQVSLAAMALTSTASVGRIYGFEAIQRHLRTQKRDHTRKAQTSIAQFNRWTGKPHEHRREIERRLRQAAR